MKVLKYFNALLYLAALVPRGHAQSVPVNVPYDTVQASIITDTVKWDTDDPAIWIHPTDRNKSLIIGTDKETDGAIYAFDLKGRIVKRVGGLRRPNNIDVAYGFVMNGTLIDVAVVTEREAQRLRVFRLPDLTPIDAGDLILFDGDKNRAPMGVALYKRIPDGVLFAVVGGKSGPAIGYLHQYRLECGPSGKIELKFVRSFGRYSGEKEIESIAVDAELGYVYYSDETVGVRKYHANPDAVDANKELALFATNGFERDHEGISIYKMDDGTGYILVSDQQTNRFQIFSREGSPENPHAHRLLKVVQTSASDSDGSEVTSVGLPPLFPSGLFVAMSDDKTFHFFSWGDIAGDDLKKRNSE